jgi:hypothetical protein
MAKVKRGTTITRTSATPLTPGVPAQAPLRPALTAGSEEAETAHAKLTDPHRTGADRVPLLRAHLTAAQQRAAHKKAHGRLPTPAKPAAKPVAKTKKKSAAAKPAVTPPTPY